MAVAVLPAWISCPPSGGVFRLSFSGSSPCIPCRRSCGFQGAVLDLAIKKSPHNNLNLTIPSGIALVRVCYVAIRKLKTCSGSFGSRAGTLSKICYIKLLEWITTKIEPCQQKVLKTRYFRQIARKCSENFGKKREPGGFVLLICFLPTVPGTAPAPHPPARRKCPRGCGTRRPERPDWPPPGTR